MTRPISGKGIGVSRSLHYQLRKRFVRYGPDGLHPALLSESHVAGVQKLAIAFPLVFSDLNRHGTQTLVGDDGSLLDELGAYKKRRMIPANPR